MIKVESKIKMGVRAMRCKRLSVIWLMVGLLMMGCSASGGRGTVADSSTGRGQAETSIPTLVATPEPEKSEKEKIQEIIAKMTLKEKLGQLFIVDLGLDVEGNARTHIDEGLQKMIEENYVGGVILFKGNIVGKEQVKQLTKDLQATSKIPLWIGVDEEGGSVSRVGSNPNIVEVPFKEAYSMGQTKDPSIAYQEAKRMGKVLNDLGFNIDFAPDADLFNNPQNKVIGHRSFGHTKEEVIPMVISFSKGLQEEGIFSVIKHFPGHGNTIEDSHEGFAYVNKSLKALEQEELVPFERAFQEGVEAVMIGHLIVPEVDAINPATLSTIWGEYMNKHYAMENILRFTDAMNMGAIVKHYTAEQAAVKNILAGGDIIVMPEDLERAISGLEEAIKVGEIEEERINGIILKILSKKVEQNVYRLE